MGEKQRWVEFLVPIELFRDGAQSPWGFRLRGGCDVEGGTPLEIIKVFVGGSSEGLLQVGDRIISINNHNTHTFSHFEAQQLFKNSGTSVKLHVLRYVECCDSNLSLPNTLISRCKNQWTEERPTSPLTSYSAPPLNHQRRPDTLQHSLQPSYLHLPTPKDSILSKPHESETFKIIMRQEIGSAKNQSGISAKKFEKSGSSFPGGGGRPLSQISDNSDEFKFQFHVRFNLIFQKISIKIPFQPVLQNTSINQSTSFKKLMNSMKGETEF